MVAPEFLLGQETKIGRALIEVWKHIATADHPGGLVPINLVGGSQEPVPMEVRERQNPQRQSSWFS